MKPLDDRNHPHPGPLPEYQERGRAFWLTRIERCVPSFNRRRAALTSGLDDF
jgi:hypothetical protein